MVRFVLACLILFASTLTAQVAPAAAPAPVSASAASARPYTLLYVFGDSYSDSGAGYVDSNGPTAVVYLAQRLGIPFTYNGDAASSGKGLNFAVSAASSGEGAGNKLPGGVIFGLGMKNQVDDFVQMLKAGTIPKIDADHTMFYFAGGLNDGGKPAGFTRASIEAEVDTLYDLGARRFMIALLPTKIPVFSAAGVKGNAELATIPAEEKAKHPDIRIANSHWGSFFDEVITNPAKYGITDTTTDCAQRSFGNRPVEACANPEAHFYYHSAHPSTATHRAVGDMLYQEAITAAP